MVKIRVRTREMRSEAGQRMLDPDLWDESITSQEKIDKKIAYEKASSPQPLTPDIDPEDIVEIVSEDYEIEDRFSADAYDEYLDDIYPTISIGYNEYNPSEIIKELSPTDYEIGYGEWRTWQEENIAEEMVDEEPEFLASPTYWENVLSKFPFPQFR